MNGETVDRFADLFEGRADAYGTEEGGCVRDSLDWPRLWLDHLSGMRTPIGVYPMVPRPLPEHPGVPDEWVVKWGCVDFDVITPTKPAGDYPSEQGAHQAALDLVYTLRVVGPITGWIEVTKSRGRHVWVFSAEWVPASTMRRALLVASQIAGTPTREVNPKAESQPSAEVLGNYVRLPYPGAVSASGSRFILDGGIHEHPINLELFTTVATLNRVSLPTLQALADLWVPPPTLRAQVDVGEVPELDETLRKKLGGLSWTILSNGPLEGADRSGTLFKLGATCFEDGLTPEEAYAVIEAADLAWGKFHTRADCEKQLTRIIDRTYAGYEPDEPT